MKKEQILILLALSLWMGGCHKNEATYDTYFYSISSVEGGPSLYVDGDYKGELPVLSQKPTCSNDSLKSRSLHLRLKGGKYTVQVKDRQGEVRSSGTVKFTKNRTSCSGGKGGQEVTAEGECIVIGLSY